MIPQVPGVINISQHDNMKYTLEVDTKVCSIGKITSILMNMGNVFDITISDPPMEDIIADIYRKTGI